MSAEDTKGIVRRGFDALNERDWAAFDALCDSGIMYHNASTTTQGYPAYIQSISMYFTAFPDARLTIEDMIAEGDSVAVRQTFHGTHQGELKGIAPTGKPVTATGMSIFRVANGRVVEQWDNYDDLGLLQQLGVVPSMG